MHRNRLVYYNCAGYFDGKFEGYNQLPEKIGQLKMRSADGKLHSAAPILSGAFCHRMFRLIQCILKIIIR
jgi:hypothetical protein